MNNKAEGIIPPDSEHITSDSNGNSVALTYSSIDQKNRTEAGNKPTQSNDFGKCGKTTHWGKDSLINKWCWENSISKCKKNEIGCLSYTIYKIQFKMI